MNKGKIILEGSTVPTKVDPLRNEHARTVDMIGTLKKNAESTMTLQLYPTAAIFAPFQVEEM